MDSSKVAASIAHASTSKKPSPPSSAIRMRLVLSAAVLLPTTWNMPRASAQADKPQSGQEQVKKVLRDFHKAAATANSEQYFKLTDKDLVFYGTDATERFSQDKLKAFAKPYFSKGIGWTYVPRQQNVVLSKDRRLAWFDEQLDNEKYGVMRGSGVLRRSKGEWKIVQYNLSFQLPNQLVPEWTRKIAAATAKPKSAKIPERPAKPSKDPVAAAKETLMDWRRAAAETDGPRYFGYFSKGAVLFGSDPNERWTIEALKKLVQPYFDMKMGWTSIPVEQNVYLASNGRLAWFDERVISSKWGVMRGTGVLRKVDGRWKIAHYNVTFPVPNDLAKELVKNIKALPGDQ